MRIPALFDNKVIDRETAIEVFDGTFARLNINPFYLGMAVGKAMAYWSLDIISYGEYRYYVDALDSAYYNKEG